MFKELLQEIIKRLQALENIDTEIETTKNKLAYMDEIIDSKLGRENSSKSGDDREPKLLELSINELAKKREMLTNTLKTIEENKNIIKQIGSILNIDENTEVQQAPLNTDVNTIAFLLAWLEEHNIDEETLVYIKSFFLEEKIYESRKLYEIQNTISELSDLSESFLKDYPNNTFNYYLLSSLYRTQDNLDEEENVLKKIQKLEPQNTKIYILLSSVLLQKEQPSQAIDWIDFGLENTDLYNLDLLLYKAKLLGKLHRFNDQVNTLNTTMEYAAETNPDEQFLVDLYRMLGMGNLQIGNNQSAIEYFKKAIKIFPARSFPYQKLAEIYQEQNEVRELIITLEKGILNVPDPTDKKRFLNRLGNFYRQINQLNDSINTYKKILDISPDDSNALVEIAVSYYKLYDYSNAEKVLREALSIDSENISAKNLLRKINVLQNKAKPSKEDLFTPKLKEEISFENLIESLPQDLQSNFTKINQSKDYSKDNLNSRLKTIMRSKTSPATQQKVLKELATYACSGNDLEGFLTTIVLYLLKTNYILIKQLVSTATNSSKRVIIDQLEEYNIAILKLAYLCETLPKLILNDYTFQRLPLEIQKRINKYSFVSKEFIYLCIKLIDLPFGSVRKIMSFSNQYQSLVIDELISLYEHDSEKVMQIIKLDWKNEHRMNFGLKLLTSTRYISPENRRQLLQNFLGIDENKLTGKSRSTLGLVSSLGDSYYIYNKEDNSTSEKSTYYNKLLTDVLNFESLIDSHFQRTPYVSIVKNTFNAFERLLKNETKKAILLPNLTIDLITQSCPMKEEAIIIFRITNSGLGPANDVKIILSENEEFALVDNEYFVGLLSSKDSLEIEIKVNPFKDGEYKISGEVISTNLNNKIEKSSFEDIISFYSLQDFKPIHSPYISGPPVKSSEMFYGRKEIMENIFNKLRGIYQDNVLVLYGQRRTGKSSIIYQILYNKDVDFRRHYIPVLIDMQGLKSANTSRLCRKIFEKIGEEIEQRMRTTQLGFYHDFKEDPIGTLDDFLDQLNRKFPDYKVLLLFDEFEGLLESINEKRVEPHFLDNLRSWMQHKENLSFVIVGADQLRNMMQDYASVLFNIAQFVQIGHLNENEAKDLITLPLKDQLRFDDLAVKKVLVLSGCNAYYIQLICAALVERMNSVFRNRVTLIDIDKTISQKITVFGNYFEHLWHKANILEKIIISVVAQHIDLDKDIVSFDDIKKSLSKLNSIDVTEGKINNSLRKLVERQILISEESSNEKFYRFFIDLFRLRIKGSYTLQDVMREYAAYE